MWWRISAASSPRQERGEEAEVRPRRLRLRRRPRLIHSDPQGSVGRTIGFCGPSRRQTTKPDRLSHDCKAKLCPNDSRGGL
jgi:hypothetical protein